MVQWYCTHCQKKLSDNALSDTSSQPIKYTARQFVQAYTSRLSVVQLEEA